MNEADKIAARIQRAIPNVPVGSLRFWGEWFGRPYDNWHTLTSCRAEQGVLLLSFGQGETLSVWSPRGFTLNESTFRISDADRVRWTWFSYGLPQREENLFFLDFLKTSEGISASRTDVSGPPVLRPTKSEAAVEILSLML